jgi:hypothetical protein
MKGILTLALCAVLAACASSGAPLVDSVRAEIESVTIVVEAHPGHTLPVHVGVECQSAEWRNRPTRIYRQIRSGQRITLPACSQAVVAAWSSEDGWAVRLPLYPGYTYNLRIQRPFIYSSILHASST